MGRRDGWGARVLGEGGPSRAYGRRWEGKPSSVGWGLVKGSEIFLPNVENRRGLIFIWKLYFPRRSWGSGEGQFFRWSFSGLLIVVSRATRKITQR